MFTSAKVEMHPNLKRLSHSAQVLFETCPRLFELDRLESKADSTSEDKDIHLAFGQVVGLGVQLSLCGLESEEVLWKMFLSWPRDLFPQDEEEDTKEVNSKKSFFFAVHAVRSFLPLRATEFPRLLVASFSGMPAIELGFTVDCGEGFSYRGKLDALLINDGVLSCLEIKTTGGIPNPASYTNSGQGIIYSAVLDAVASTMGVQQRDSFFIYYPVYSSNRMEWTVFRFKKSRMQITNWIRHVVRTVQHITEYAEDGYFPQHGQSCYNFFKPCKFLDICDMKNDYIVGRAPALKQDAEGEYIFHFSLDDIIQAQLDKIKE